MVAPHPDLREAAHLAESARKLLEAGRVEGACWRLADALGLCWGSLGAGRPVSIEGLDKPTGRGYQLHLSWAGRTPRPGDP